MSSPQFSKHRRRRTLRRARGRLPELLVLFSVTLIGVALGGSFFVGSSSVLQSLDEFWERGRLESGSFAGPDNTVVDAPGIEAMRSVDVPGPRDSTVRIFAPRDELNRHEVVAGRDVAGGDEVVLDAKYAEAQELRIGDAVTIDGRELTLVGHAVAPDYVNVKNSQVVLQPNPDEFGVGFISAGSFDAAYDGHATIRYAYSDDWSPAQVMAEFAPQEVRDTENNSRVQQVIGDSAAPRDLAALIFVVFMAITAALLMVYHYETRRREERNRQTLDQLGLSSQLGMHYRIETTLVLTLAWVAAMVVILVAVRPVMSINGQLYNYPELDIHWPILGGVAAGSLVALLLLDWSVYRLMHRRDGRAARASRVRRSRGPVLTTARLSWLPDFGYRLRVVRMVRRPGEALALLGLMLIVGLFINFSLMLKASVDEWVAVLGPDTPYSQMYTLPPGGGNAVDLRSSDEAATLATLYDDEEVAQMVYEVPAESRYFGTLEGVAVTEAFQEKYDTGPGDVVALDTIDGGASFELPVASVVDIETSAFVYVPKTMGEQVFGDELPRVDVVFTENVHPDLDGLVPAVTREQIISSGESITRIIEMQVTLLIAVSVLLLGIMLFSIYRFTFGNQRSFIRIMRSNGYQAGVILRALFGFSVLMVLVAGAVSYVVSFGIVRVFFDQIMFRFVNYVPVSSAWWVPAAAIGAVLILLAVMLVLADRNLRSPRRSRAATAATPPAVLGSPCTRPVRPSRRRASIPRPAPADTPGSRRVRVPLLPIHASRQRACMSEAPSGASNPSGRISARVRSIGPRNR